MAIPSPSAVATPRFGDDFLRDQQSQLDPDAGKSDPFSTFLGARRHVVVARQFAPLHAAAIVNDGQRGVGGIGEQPDVRCTGIERVRDHFRENGFLERTCIGVAQIFEKMLQVDPGLAHSGILS
jgi:hypothetical protein